MSWWGWGDPARRPGLSRHAERFLEAEIGRAQGLPPVALEEVRLRPSALTDGARRRLEAAVGRDNVRSDRRSRVGHAGGKSYPDLVRRRRGDAEQAPDAVVLAGSHEEVRAVLDACADERVAVVPFGGGTSVVGGVEPVRDGFAAVVSLDLSRMDRLLGVDGRSLTATFQPGMRGLAAEARLAERGLTLGHFPQSFEYATVGGFVATRSAGQASTGYGRIDDLVLGLRCAAPAGDLDAGRVPASAAGPDLRALLVGSEGLLGVITEVTLRVRPAPATRRYEGWSLPSFPDGLEALRRLAQSDLAPDVARLSDPEETRVSLAQQEGLPVRLARGYLRARGHRGGCLLVAGWEGSGDGVAFRRRRAAAALRRHGGIALGGRPGRAWLRSRFAGPYLRDDLLDRGVLVDTLETAAPWSRLPAVHASVAGALRQALSARGTPPLVLCHVSHVYASGASLYYTFLARQEAGEELEQWQAAKTAASAAIVGAGATITHHHAVGRDHAAWMHAEVGRLGLAVLRAVKDRLDPAGILNPGKLLPPEA